MITDDLNLLFNIEVDSLTRSCTHCKKKKFSYRGVPNLFKYDM